MSATDKQIPAYVRFGTAGAAGVGAVLVTHPFDVIKFRMQMSGKGKKEQMKENTSFHAAVKIMEREGISAFYNGISANVLRQLTITMVRLGLYNAVVDQLTADDGTPPPVFYQILAGIFSGGVGAIVGNPCDIALVRMAMQGSLPENERAKTYSAIGTMKKIAREEGFGSLWLGWRPNLLRCILLNLTQIVLYKNTKTYLLHTGHFHDNIVLHLVCSLWTGVFCSIATAPVDITKTRLQARKHDVEYKGMIDVAVKIVEHGGIKALWRGITPTFLRIFPHNCMIFILLENLTKLYKSLVLGDASGSGL